MRLSAAALLVCLLASPAAAAETIADQADAAYALFAGGLSEQDYLAAHYGKAALSNVGGKWVRLNGPAPKTGIETYGVDSAKFCQSPAALTLASPTNMVLTLTTNLKGTSNFNQQYTLIAGSTFAEHTDPDAYFAAVGLGPEKAGDQADQQRALLLALANGIVQIYRPSDDILVMTRDRGYPIVLARCPAAAPTTDPSSSAPPDAASSSSSAPAN